MIGNLKSDIGAVKNGGVYDFQWTFEKNTEPGSDDIKFKHLLLEMYKHSTSSFLVLKSDEEHLLKKYKLI